MPTSFAKALLYIILFFKIAEFAKQNCYKIRLRKVRMTGTENFMWNATIHSNNTVSTYYRLLKAVPIPIWNLKLIQSTESYEKVLFSNKMKACDLLQIVNSIKILRDTTASILGPDKGNLSLECPMPAGTYVMRNMHVSPDSRVLRFLYVPNSVLTLKAEVLSLLPNYKMQKLGWFDINGTMTRSC